jgi:hypothetical protein
LDESGDVEVRKVRAKAQEFLDRGPTDDDPPVILDMIAKALPGDEHAAKLGQSWEAERRRGS